VDATFIRVKGGGHGFGEKGIAPSMDEITEKVLGFFDRVLRVKR